MVKPVRRYVKLVALPAATVLLVAVLVILPDCLRAFLPRFVNGHPVEFRVLLGVVLYLFTCWALESSRLMRWSGQIMLARARDRVETVSRALLEQWLAVGLGLLALYWLATWLPHYPFWPWGRDTDTFAVIAQAWEAGELPYRDIRGYNFPGHTYIHWILGKLFGWGHPSVFLLADGAGLLLLGGVFGAWSVRCYGSRLPGLMAYVGVLGFYLGQDVGGVAERDWHAPLGAVLALLVSQGWPGRPGRWISAALAAGAFTIRPHLLLFLPALLVAAMNWGCPVPEQDGFPRKRALVDVIEWLVAFGVFVALAFAPLAWAGVLGDLIRSVRITAYGGPYSTATFPRSLAIFREQLDDPITAGVLLLLALLLLRRHPPKLRPLAAAWLLALLGALLYRPLHPVDHGYLKLALGLIRPIAWAVAVSGFVVPILGWNPRIPVSVLGVVAVLLTLYDVIPAYPKNCDMTTSFKAIRACYRGVRPELPPGAWSLYSERRQPYYTWEDYGRLLDYVSRATGPETIVANVLLQFPYPSINGPTGRRSPFRCESGIAWMLLVDEDLDEVFTRQLEEAGGDSIVVWSQAEIGTQPRIPAKRLTEAIRRLYRPEAKFGHVEVWRRRTYLTGMTGIKRPRSKLLEPLVFGGNGQHLRSSIFADTEVRSRLAFLNAPGLGTCARSLP